MRTLGETLTSVLGMSNSCSARLYWSPEKKLRQEPGARLQRSSSPYTLNCVPLSSLFHLPPLSFIKSAFISLHHPRPVFTSILFSSQYCSIDSGAGLKHCSLFKRSACYVLWQCHLPVTCVGEKNLIASSFTSPTHFTC